MDYKYKEYDNYEKINKDAYYGRGEDDYNQPLELIASSDELYRTIRSIENRREEKELGALLVITDKQWILTYNGNYGSGSHNTAMARVYADMTDKAKLNYIDVKTYFHKLEERFLHAKMYIEKYTPTSKVTNILSFSFNRSTKSITQNEYEGFRRFYDEYAELIKLKNFDVSFMGKTMDIDTVKERLESMIDPYLDLSNLMECDEVIIGQRIDDEQDKRIMH